MKRKAKQVNTAPSPYWADKSATLWDPDRKWAWPCTVIVVKRETGDHFARVVVRSSADSKPKAKRKSSNRRYKSSKGS